MFVFVGDVGLNSVCKNTLFLNLFIKCGKLIFFVPLMYNKVSEIS